jgi:hypothetical protein
MSLFIITLACDSVVKFYDTIPSLVSRMIIKDRTKSP